MTRNKQIRQAASEARAASAETLTTHGTQHYLDDIIGIELSYDEIAESAFTKGAEWADANPAWRMCKDELPDKPCMCVCHDGERMFFAEWVDETPQGLSGWSINGVTKEPIAWLPIPQFNPKAEGE